MNRNLQVLIEVATAGGFAVSALLTSLRTLSGWAPVTNTPLSFERTLTGRMSLGGGADELSLLGLVAQPTTALLWALLAAVLGAVVLHLAARLRGRRAPPQPPAIALGLVMAALWPWVIGPAPLPGLALAAAACTALTLGLAWQCDAAQAQAEPIPGVEIPPAPGASALAFVAGWVVMAATSALGLVLFDLGMGLERAILLGLLVAALAAAWVQLRLPRLVMFSAAAIWAMIGIAAATAGTSITIATACVLGISAVAVVVVRTTT
ncbi:MAG TPA: hypothetical protein PKA35_03355 [Paracoccus solventivorans]|uniref:hypothetical protein n=1 Tax=Paracoccus solventivorans TaxID=53463 RepID=UPI002BA8C5C7|nr:hypothetical protein [Paracoccus solventivorans]HMM08142.1 hypothetical protein [Paracoccus solventivorans]